MAKDIKGFFKVTDEVMENNTLEEIINELDDKTSDLIRIAILEKEDNLMQALCGCESPIEMMIAVVLEETDILHTANFLGVDVLGVENQVEIKVEDERYRVDFLIETCHEQLKTVQGFVIECDGHEFHEKTKEQVAKNNKRTRELLKKGYVVIHFSGSEIYESPFKCVAEIKNIITSWYRERIKEHEERAK